MFSNRILSDNFMADNYSTGFHLDFIFRHFSDPHIYRYLVDEEPVSTQAQAQGIIDFYTKPTSSTYNRWVLVHKSKERRIGTCGYHLWSRDHRRAEIGYDLDHASWHQGFMTEALTAALDFGFTQMDLNRISVMVHPENAASLALLARLGFQNEFICPQYSLIHQAQLHSRGDSPPGSHLIPFIGPQQRNCHNCDDGRSRSKRSLTRQ